jgi:hypothetical protein
MKPSNLLTTLALAVAVLFTGCKKDDFVETVGVCPIVITTSPVNLATNVPLNKIVTATFNVNMNPATIIPAAFSLQSAKKGAASDITGVLSYDATSKTMSFVPDADFTVNTTYTAIIKSTVKDMNGTALQGDYVWLFSTGALVVPTVILTDPLNLATAVVLNKTVTANFSEAMSAATISATTFTLKNGATPVAGVVTYAGTTASFNPNADLLPGVLYTATITTGAQNVAGVPMSANYVWSFTTLSAAPTVILTDPANLAVGVAINKTLTASFSEAMNAATLTATSFTLKEGLNSVIGVVSYAGVIASFNPNVDLLPGTTYTATITTGATSASGTAMANNYVWTFTTLASSAPTVISTVPADLASGVLVNQNVSADFSEAMNGATLTATSFTLTDGVTPVVGVVSYAGITATLNPNVDLLPGTTYTATITTAAMSAGGVAMVSNKVWTFTTLAAAVPSVIATIPMDLATNVPLNQVVSADFSEAMNIATISSSTFTLMDGVTPVLGAVNYSGTTATFTPTVALVLGKTYTATITTGAQNLAGTGIASDYVWTFSTGAALPLGPGVINLGTAANFTVLSKAGISTTGLTSVTGDIGVSPIDQTALTGFSQIMDASGTFSTSIYVTGKLYASDYLVPTPSYMTTAVSDMETALTAGMGMTTSVINELGAGDISGMTLVPGLYKWGTGLLITSAGVTLSGGPDDTWVFQISSDLTVNNGAIITLSGGAQAKNIFWVTNTQALLGTSVDFSGNIIAQTLISLNTGAKVTGRLLSQTAVTLDAATVIKP